VRSTDSVGRLGGDEFGIFCGALETSEEAHRLAERVRSVVDKPLSVQGIAVTTGASIGIAFMRLPRQPIEDSIDEADQAMYIAKSRGGNCWIVYD
jgi:diguanylate cyclase (GGDEF)-like protein